MHTETRSATRSTKPQAAPNEAADLAGLLEPQSLDEAASARSFVEARQREVLAAVADHGRNRDAALMQGGDAWTRWSAEADRLEIERERCAKALELIADATAALEAQARDARADAAQREAEAALAAGLPMLQELDAIAERYRDTLHHYRNTCALIASRNATLRESGRPPVALPHDAASEPDRYEVEDVRVAAPRLGVFDLAGRPVRDVNAESAQVEFRTERRERYIRGRRARDMARAEVCIPAAMDAGAYMVRQG